MWEEKKRGGELPKIQKCIQRMQFTTWAMVWLLLAYFYQIHDCNDKKYKEVI